MNHKNIQSLIPPASKILDLGCGDGSLIETLKHTKQCRGYGVDINYRNIITCAQKGIPIYQGNLDEGLSAFSNQSYDIVILSQTLQQVQRPLFVIEEMLRVGKMGIITFPNFAHWQTRQQLFLGKIPQTKSLPYSWHETPNIRVISIDSFRETCQKNNITIIKENHICRLPIMPNFFATRGVFLIQKKK